MANLESKKQEFRRFSTDPFIDENAVAPGIAIRSSDVGNEAHRAPNRRTWQSSVSQKRCLTGELAQF
jgi:hypothetical protein